MFGVEVDGPILCRSRLESAKECMSVVLLYFDALKYELAAASATRSSRD